MRNIFLVAKREYIERVRTRAFVLTTVLLPLFVVGIIAIPIYLTTKSDTGRSIVVVTPDARLGSYIVQDITEEAKPDVNQPPSQSRQVPEGKPKATYMAPTPDLQTALHQRVEQKQLSGYLWIDASESSSDQPHATYYSSTSGNLMFNQELSSALHSALVRERLMDSGLSQSAIDKLNAHVEIDTQTIDKGTTQKKSDIGTYLGAYLMMMLLYISVILYGMNVSRSIIEEKTTRVFEVLLSTVKPIDLMFGKIIGVGAVGLTQLAAWILMGAAALAYPALVMTMQENKLNLGITPMQMVYFAIFFVLGYLFYSAMSAALGASVNSDREMQQLSLIVTGPLIACMVCFQLILANPDSVTSEVLSLFPPFTPLLMYLRISVSHVPLWQIVLSIVLLTGSTAFMIALCSRIYRVGILMYGKRPTLPEILRWLRYS